MDDTWETADWAPTSKSAASWQAGIEEINSFFDSPAPAPYVFAGTAIFEQLPAAIVMSQNASAAGQQEEVKDEQAPPGTADDVVIPDSGGDFSTLLEDLENVYATAAQEQAGLAVGDDVLADFTGLLPHMESEVVDWAQQQLQQELHASSASMQPLITDDETAGMMDEPDALHHEPEVSLTYPLPGLTHLQPTLLPTPVPDVVLLADGSVNTNQHTPSTVGKGSLLGEMRDEEANGNFPIRVQPLPLGASLLNPSLATANAESEASDLAGHTRIDISDLLNSVSPEDRGGDMSTDGIAQAFLPLETSYDKDGTGPDWDKAGHVELTTSNDWQDTVAKNVEQAETTQDEWRKKVSMGPLGQMLSSKMLADVGGLSAEEIETHEMTRRKPSSPSRKRERGASSPDPFNPTNKRVKMQVTAQTKGLTSFNGVVVDEQPLGNKLINSHQRSDMPVKQSEAYYTPPADVEASTDSPSVLTNASDLDAPGSLDELLTDNRPVMAAAENHVRVRAAKNVISSKEVTDVRSVVMDAVNKRVNKKSSISQSPRKTRQQKKALEDAKPSAAAKRRREAK